jgi:hypothetical protein
MMSWVRLARDGAPINTHGNKSQRKLPTEFRMPTRKKNQQNSISCCRFVSLIDRPSNNYSKQ